MTKREDELMLPNSLVTQRDLRRLVNEIEQVDSEMSASGVQERIGGGINEISVLSEQLDDLVGLNSIDLNDASTRSLLIERLRKLKTEAPVVHLTFASNAGKNELMKIIDWVRQSVHPKAILTIGLQPDLIGGVFVRTTNRVFDFSVRSQLKQGRSIITEELKELSGAI